MISLISRWKLRNGATPELLHNLARAVERVRDEEQEGTLMYLVHLRAPNPLGSDFEPIHPPPNPPDLSQQTEVVFIEAYRDAEAFAAHVHGDPFQQFLRENLHFFYEDPTVEGWPLTETPFLTLLEGFVRAFYPPRG